VTPNTGIVHQEVHGPDLSLDPGDHDVHGGAIGDIQCHRVLYPGFLGQFDKFAGGTSHSDNLIAAVGQLDGDDSPNTVARSGYECNRSIRWHPRRSPGLSSTAESEADIRLPGLRTTALVHPPSASTAGPVALIIVGAFGFAVLCILIGSYLSYRHDRQAGGDLEAN